MLRDNQQFNESIKSNSAFLDELRQKMPEFFTATKYDEEGHVIESSTFDNAKFQQALKEHNIDELSSGYRLDFIGKNYAKKQAGERPTTVIVPDNDHNQKEENKNSKNLFFTGDNLEVLRHLQQNYANSVDFIYIDPPYNTGSDGFVYPDNFEYSDDQLKEMFGLNEDELKRLKSIQGKATHSAWLTFMYPRLYLAKKVLKDTGVIFISIDDNEQANLKLLMDEVFGEGSFIAKFDWRKKTGANDAKDVAVITETILLYSKNYATLLKNEILTRDINSVNRDRYKLQDEFVETRGKYYLDTLDRGGLQYSDSMNFVIDAPDGGEIWPNGRSEFYNDGWIWKWGKSKVIWGIENKFLEFVPSSKSKGSQFTVKYKVYEKVDNEGNVRQSSGRAFSNLILNPINQQGKADFSGLFDGSVYFSNPKPVKLIQFFLNMINNKELVTLDFFAGSSTTADAVMQLNAEDGGNRQYIMCTLPEPTFTVNSDGKEVPTKGGETAYKAGYRSIDEISRERIIRAANKIKEENPLLAEKQDFGFKHYRVVPPTQETLEKIDYDDHLQLDLFDDMIDVFSSKKLGVAGNADGFDTIFHTYLAQDNYQFDVPIKLIDFAGIQLPYVNNQRIYLIAKNWQAENTRALVNAIGKNELVVQTIVVYGYTLEMESLRELEIALNQLENKVNLQVRY